MSEAHPITRHPLHGVPCPSPPDFWYTDPEKETTELQKNKMAFFVTVVGELRISRGRWSYFTR
jgi:hypothetical protein